MTLLTDQVVLITGAGRGLGAAIAESFAAQGAIIAANDITPINLNKVVRRIAATDVRVKSYVHDISKKMPVQAMLNAIINDWGRLDIVVNAANVNPRASILELDAWDWQRTLDVNLTGAFFITQSAGRIMQAQGGGKIINIATSNNTSHKAAYITSKMGIIGLTKESAREFSTYNIHIHAICAGCLGDPDKPAKNTKQTEEALTQLALALCCQDTRQLAGKIIDIDDQEMWQSLLPNA